MRKDICSSSMPAHLEVSFLREKQELSQIWLSRPWKRTAKKRRSMLITTNGEPVCENDPVYPGSLFQNMITGIIWMSVPVFSERSIHCLKVFQPVLCLLWRGRCEKMSGVW